MEFKLSDHARERIQQRKIKPEWIAIAITHPDQIENDFEDHSLVHALKLIPEKSFRKLRVIYNETTEPVTIVTAYFEQGEAMKIEFDQLADALYIHLSEGDVEKTEEIKPGRAQPPPPARRH